MNLEAVLWLVSFALRLGAVAWLPDDMIGGMEELLRASPARAKA